MQKKKKEEKKRNNERIQKHKQNVVVTEYGLCKFV